MSSVNQSPGGYKFAPLMASQHNDERTSTSPLALGYLLLLGPSRHVRAYESACRSPALSFSAAIHFAMKCSAFCSAVLRHPPSSWTAVVHYLALVPKALRSSKKHHIHSFPWPPTQPAPPTTFPSIRHFGSLVSSMRATNPAKKLLLHTLIAMQGHQTRSKNKGETM